MYCSDEALSATVSGSLCSIRISWSPNVWRSFKPRSRVMKLLRIKASWVLAICITPNTPSTNPISATVISAEMLRNRRVRSLIASFIAACSQVVLLAFAIQRGGVNAQGFGRLVEGVTGGQHGADVCLLQLVET